MANEEIVEVDELEELPEVAEGEEDTTNYKTLASKHLQSAKRYKKLLEKEKLEKKVEKKAEKELEKKAEKTEFDYAELAYLEAKSVPEEDHDYVFNEVKTTGKSLKEVLAFKYVQETLKENKHSRENRGAVPGSTKRAGGSLRDSVEYWMSKGELPPKDQVKLRREVVKARMKAHQESESHFTENPVV